MAGKMFAAAMLGLFILVSFCAASNPGNDKNGTALLNSSSINATNSTNSTVNLTNIPFNSTNGTLKTPIIILKTNKSDLMNWGNAPKGYARDSNNNLVPEAALDAEGSVMETPSEAVPNNNANNQVGGLLVRPTNMG